MFWWCVTWRAWAWKPRLCAGWGIKISLLNPWLCAVCHHMLSDALSLAPCSRLPLAISYRRGSINRARSTLGRLEERKERSCCDPLWLLKPQSERSGYMNSSRHTHTTNTHKTHTHTHTPAHTHAKLHWESGSCNGNSESWALLCHSEPKSLWHWVTTGLPVCSFACLHVWAWRSSM